MGNLKHRVRSTTRQHPKLFQITDMSLEKLPKRNGSDKSRSIKLQQQKLVLIISQTGPAGSLVIWIVNQDVVGSVV